MAVVNRVPELLKKHYGTRYSIARVVKDTGIQRTSVYLWLNPDIQRCDTLQIERWCKLFNCKVCDVLEYVPDEAE